MKKLVLISLGAFAILLLVGCGKKTEVTTSTDTVSIEETSHVAKKEATKEQCMEIVQLGMQITTAQMQGDATLVASLSKKSMEVEKKYQMEGIEFETTCQKYMTDADFMKMLEQGLGGK